MELTLLPAHGPRSSPPARPSAEPLRPPRDQRPAPRPGADEARERAVAEIDNLEKAREAAVAARRTADAAPRRDAEEKHAAIRANRKPPKATAPAATEAGERDLAAVREALETLQAGFDRLAERAGVVTAMHTGENWKPANKALRDGPNVDTALADLHEAAGAMWEAAVPLDVRILALVPTTGATGTT